MKGMSIEERAIELAQYIIDSKDTVRGTAKKFGISKSTVHKDVSERLKKINPSLAHEVRKILDLKSFSNSCYVSANNFCVNCVG